MPQMAPINWLFLYIMFCITLLIFNMMNYYLFIKNYKSPTNMNKDTSPNQLSMNWKW